MIKEKMERGEVAGDQQKESLEVMRERYEDLQKRCRLIQSRVTVAYEDHEDYKSEENRKKYEALKAEADELHRKYEEAERALYSTWGPEITAMAEESDAANSKGHENLE